MSHIWWTPFKFHPIPTPNTNLNCNAYTMRMWDCGIKVNIQKMMKISPFGHKEWLEIHIILFKVGIEDMMRNACCFVTSSPCKLLVPFFPKRQVSQTPYLYTRASLIWASNYPTMHTNAHNMVNSLAPKSDHKWCEITPIWPIIALHLSLHPFRATTFVSRLGPYNNNCTPSSMHQLYLSIVFDFSTL